MSYTPILRDSSIFATSAVFAALLSIVQAIIIAKLLGPLLYGKLQIYRLILTYSAYTTAGTFMAMAREMSYYRGMRDYGRCEIVKNVTFSLNLWGSLLTGTGVAILLFVWPRDYPTPAIEIGIVVLLVIGQRFFGYAVSYFMAIKEFMMRSAMIILFALVHLIFAVLLGIVWEIRGVLTGMIIAYGLCIVYGRMKGAFHVRLVVEKEDARNLLRTGLPIFVNALLSILLVSIDRLMVVLFLPVIQLGYFGIAAMIKALIEKLYTSAYSAIFPRLTERYGETSRTEDIKNYVTKPLMVSAHLAPVFLGSMIIVIPVLIKIILPKYAPGILPAQLIIASSFFGCLQGATSSFFVAINRVPKMYPPKIAAVLAGAGTMWLATRLGWGIEGVAFCVVLSSALLAFLLMRSFLGFYSISTAAKIKFFLAVNYPFVYMCGCLWIVGLISIRLSNPTMAGTLNGFLRLIFFWVLNIPLLVILQVKTGIIGEMKKTAVYLVQVKLRKSGETLQSKGGDE